MYSRERCFVHVSCSGKKHTYQQSTPKMRIAAVCVFDMFRPTQPTSRKPLKILPFTFLISNLRKVDVSRSIIIPLPSARFECAQSC